MAKRGDIRISWRIEDWKPGGERQVLAWVNVEFKGIDLRESREFGNEVIAEEMAVKWVRKTVDRLCATIVELAEARRKD